MEYKENELSYKDYLALRKSIGWINYPEEQAKEALRRNVYAVTAINDGQTVGMGRLIGDGIYYMIADVIVHPLCQRKGIGKKIVRMLTEYAEKQTPPGGQSSIQLIAEKGKEAFYEKAGFSSIPDAFCGTGMKKTIRKPVF